MHLYGLAVAFFFLVAVGLNCHPSAETELLARVESLGITVEDFQGRLQEYEFDPKTSTASDFLKFKKKILHELVEEKVMILEARKRKIKVEAPELNQAITEIKQDYPHQSFQSMLDKKKISYARWRDRMRLKILLSKVITDITKDVPSPGLKQIESYYKKYKDDFRQKEQVHLKQIVVKSKEDAKKILKELKKGALFEDLAQKHSFTPEASQGGDLGYVSKGIMPEELEKVIFKLKANKIGPIIQSQYGFHVVKVLDQKKERVRPLKEVRSKIAQTLTQKQREKRLETWRKETFSKIKIERNDSLLASLR